MRNDIGEIIQFAKVKGFLVSVSSNGILVPTKISELKPSDDLKLSFDGLMEIHESLRGKGSFSKLTDAIECCHENNIKFSLQCVLSNQNFDAIDYLLETARKLQRKILFQPGIKSLLWVKDKTNRQPPSLELYKKQYCLFDGSQKKRRPYSQLPGGSSA